VTIARTLPRRLALAVLSTAAALMSAHSSTAHAAPITPPLTTDGARLVDARGRTVVLQGVNWFGFETSNHVVHGLWTRDYRDMLAQVRRLGFNTIRLPFSLEALRSRTLTGIDFSGGKNAALRGATPQRAMDVIVDEAARHGLFVILDYHSGPDNAYTDPFWYGRGYTEDDWVRAWVALAQRYRGRPNVIGADLKNEPHGEATWGTGGATDWRRAATRAGDAVLARAPHWLILVEGIGGSVPGELLTTHWWGGNLQGVRTAPVRLSRPRQLVYSPHEYGPGVFPQPWFQRPDMARVLADRWEKEFGFIVRQGIAPLLVGEFGGRKVDPVSAEGRWQRQFLDYIGDTGMSWTYWSLNPDSGDTGGVLRDDWVSVDEPKMRLLAQLIRRRRAEGGPGAFGRSRSAPPAAAAPRRPMRPRPSRPARPRPSTPAPATASLGRGVTAAVEEEARWEGGSCARLVLSGAATGLGRRSVTLDVPAGTSIAQSWNAEASGSTGRVRVTLPDWARIEAGAPYTATGFCLAGPGRVRVVG
jgi:endoglucanase